ncbi:OLC1v1002046C3 [Oldenlandia corymbosa var. corymbosa]|uniref:OLC1v1002046C3 n=1 Tax=Oldenlandia corymbosa var. corymbosa TaxID=529605 RepID=A0AAV1D6Q0_OLDCO|nr:OLC1v1002046C3 [Oldenlandia corymbosa var. corymbosa]
MYLKDIRADDSLLLIEEQSAYAVSDVTFAPVGNISYSLPVRPGMDRVLGWCNGLVGLALRFDFGWKVILWNPALSKCKVIDELLDQSGEGSDGGSWSQAGTEYALGWLEIHNDLKVVKVCSRSHITEISIYSLTTGTWNPYGGEDAPAVIFAWSHFFAKGAIHWVCLAKVGNVLFCGIAAFNLVENRFIKAMKLPRECYDATDFFEGGSILELRGELAFFCSWIPGSGRGNNYFNIWAMQEYGVDSSWNKVFTMEINGIIDWPLGFTKSERLVCFFQNGIDEKAVPGVCNFSTREIQVFEGVNVINMVLDYMETALLI